MPSRLNLRIVPAALLFLASTALAHGDHEHIPEGEGISKDPIVRVSTAALSSHGTDGFSG